MSPRKVGVSPEAKLEVAKQMRPGKGWRVVTPGKHSGRRAILITKFKVGQKDIGIFHILPGTR